MVAIALGSLATGALGYALGHRVGADSAAGTATGTVALYGCPGSGGPSIGLVHAGDRVWLIGRTDDRWGVIRHPEDPDRPAWLPLAMVDTNATAGDLPEMACPDDLPTTQTTAVATTAVVIGGTTTTTTVASTTTTSSTVPPSTIPTDVTPPVVTITPNRPYLYVVSATPPCSDEDELEVSIAVADPTLPLTVLSIEATWNGPDGPHSSSLTPVGGNRFLLQVADGGPAGGETPLMLTATASDGAGNEGAGTAVVSLRDPASFGCAP